MSTAQINGPFQLTSRMWFDPSLENPITGSVGGYQALRNSAVVNTKFREFFVPVENHEKLINQIEHAEYGVVLGKQIPLSAGQNDPKKTPPKAYCVLTLGELAKAYNSTQFNKCISEHQDEEFDCVVKLIKDDNGKIIYILTHINNYNPYSSTPDKAELAAVGICSFLPEGHSRISINDSESISDDREASSYRSRLKAGFYVTGLSWSTTAAAIQGDTRLIFVEQNSYQDRIIPNFIAQVQAISDSKYTEEHKPPAYGGEPNDPLLRKTAQKTDEAGCCVLL